MSTKPPDAVPAAELADGKTGTAPSASGRGSVFALPVSTSFRFALLIAAVAASSVFVYQGIYLATPRGKAWESLARKCLSQALSRRPSGWSAYARALGQAATCRSGAERIEGLWALLGVGVLVALAGAIYWAQPWWYQRRMHLRVLTDEGAPALMSHLEDLRQRAGAGPVVWLMQPFNVHMSAFAFGHFRRRFVAVSGGAAVAAVRQPVAFEAVILHELAHIRNRDINQTYLALAIWRSFVVVALLPMAALLVFSREAGTPQRLLWRVAALALTVYLLRNSIVRSREFDADARVHELDPDTGLGKVLAGLPPRRGRRVWQLGWLHPSGQDRAAALLDPEPLFRCGFWDGMAVGLVAAIGASATQAFAPLFTTATLLGFLVPAAIFALFSATALAVAIWRKQLLQPETAGSESWTVGLGLAVGLAIGPIIALPAVFGPGIAPDSIRLPAIGALAGWIAFVTLIFSPLPAWIGYWANAWQKRAGRSSRVPARGGLLVASAAAWVVLAIGLGLLLAAFVLLQGLSSDPAVPQALAQVWTFAGAYIAHQPEAWVVCLATVAVPCFASLTSRLKLRSGDRRDAAWQVQHVGRTAVLCLAGGATAVVLILAISAVAHAGVAAPVRWNAFFLAQLILFDTQVVVGVGVVFALIAAATSRSAQFAVIAVAVAAVVAGIGTVVVVNAVNIGSCLGTLSIQYTHPPTDDCPRFLGGTFLLQQLLFNIVEAMLVSIILIPAAHYFGGRLMRFAAQPARLPRSIIALRGIGVGAAVIAAMVVTVLRGPAAGAHGIKPLGRIGHDGWIAGLGYAIRLYPGWYAVSQNDNSSQILLVYPVSGATVEVLAEPVSISIVSFRDALIADRLQNYRARRAMIDGARGLSIIGSGIGGTIHEAWLVQHDSLGYTVAFTASALDRATPEYDLARMLHSWHWTTSG
jgi:Zn-dependent protease with chaperone function